MDLVFAPYYEVISADIKKYEGRKIELTGLRMLAKNQLVLSRFLFTHCIADASIIGFLAQFDDAVKIEQDTWLKATGIIKVITFNGIELLMIEVLKYEKVDEHAELYLYPIVAKHS